MSANLSICSYSPWKQSDKNTTSQLNSEVTTHLDRGGGSITPPKMKWDIFWWKLAKSPCWVEACLRDMLQWHRWQFWCNSCENPFLLTKNIYLSKWNMRTQKMDSDSRCMCSLCHNISDMVWHQVKFTSFSGNFRGLVQVQQTILRNRSCSLQFGISPPSAICSI